MCHLVSLADLDKALNYAFDEKMEIFYYKSYCGQKSLMTIQ